MLIFERDVVSGAAVTALLIRPGAPPLVLRLLLICLLQGAECQTVNGLAYKRLGFCHGRSLSALDLRVAVVGYGLFQW